MARRLKKKKIKFTVSRESSNNTLHNSFKSEI